jgi:hypothetical protein
LYLLIGITEFADCEENVRDIIGWCLLGTIFFSIAVNLIKALALIIMDLRKKRRLNKAAKYAISL